MANYDEALAVTNALNGTQLHGRTLQVEAQGTKDQLPFGFPFSGFLQKFNRVAVLIGSVTEIEQR